MRWVKTGEKVWSSVWTSIARDDHPVHLEIDTDDGDCVTVDLVADELYFTFWASPNATVTLSEMDLNRILSEARPKYEESSEP